MTCFWISYLFKLSFFLPHQLLLYSPITQLPFHKTENSHLKYKEVVISYSKLLMTKGYKLSHCTTSVNHQVCICIHFFKKNLMWYLQNMINHILCNFYVYLLIHYKQRNTNRRHAISKNLDKLGTSCFCSGFLIRKLEYKL